MRVCFTTSVKLCKPLKGVWNSCVTTTYGHTRMVTRNWLSPGGVVDFVMKFFHTSPCYHTFGGGLLRLCRLKGLRSDTGCERVRNGLVTQMGVEVSILSPRCVKWGSIHNLGKKLVNKSNKWGECTKNGTLWESWDAWNWGVRQNGADVPRGSSSISLKGVVMRYKRERYNRERDIDERIQLLTRTSPRGGYTLCVCSHFVVTHSSMCWV